MQIHGDGLPESYVIALTEAADIVAHKNRGYGRDEDPWHNFRAGEAIGINPQGMVMLRILEKINRLTNHYRGAQGVDPREEALDAEREAAGEAYLGVGIEVCGHEAGRTHEERAKPAIAELLLGPTLFLKPDEPLFDVDTPVGHHGSLEFRRVA